MKKSMLVVLAVLLLALFSLPGNVQADYVEVDCLTFMLSNEPNIAGDKGLIDKLIDAGHENESLYQVLQFLAAGTGSGIPADFLSFVSVVGSSPAGGDVFTAALDNFASETNNPIGIGADGSLLIASIYGRDYDGNLLFLTNTVQYSGIGPVNFTMAILPKDYVDAGSNTDKISEGHYRITYYQAIGIAWAPTVQGVPEPSSVLLLTIGLVCLAGKARRSRK